MHIHNGGNINHAELPGNNTNHFKVPVKIVVKYKDIHFQFYN